MICQSISKCRSVASIFLSLCIFTWVTMAADTAESAEKGVKIGAVPEVVSLEKDEGGRVDGSGWSSSELTGKVHILFYVDPDKKKSNEGLEKALKKEEFPAEKFQSTAIINMAATWLPNVAIASSLSSKQKEFPRTVYVKDLNKKLVKNWAMADDEYNVVLFNRSGEALFYKTGELTEEEIAQLISAIKANL